jgi:hypothetical protein
MPATKQKPKAPAGRRIVLSLLTLAIVFLGVLWVMVFQLREQFLRAAFYQDQLRRYEIYDAVYDELSTQLAVQSPVRVAEDEAALFSLDDLRGALTEAFPSAWLQRHVEAFLASLETWIYSTAADIDFTIDVRAQKETIPAALRARMLDKFALLPVCSADALQKLLENRNQLVNCRPPGLEPAEIWAEFEQRYLSVIQVIPDELTFRALLNGELIDLDLVPDTEAETPVRDDRQNSTNYDQVMLQLENLRSARIVIDWFLLTTAIAVGVLFLLVILLNLRRALALMRWVGVIAFGLGVDLVITALLLRIAADRLAPMLQRQTSEVLSAALQTASIEVPLNALRLYGGRLLIYGLTALAVGIGLFAVRFVVDVQRQARRNRLP